MQTGYEAAGGRDGLLRLASAWHTRVLTDEVVSHAFSHGYHPQHTERLAAYWAEALGGPTTYSDQYGDETSVVRIHSLESRWEPCKIFSSARSTREVGFAIVRDNAMPSSLCGAPAKVYLADVTRI